MPSSSAMAASKSLMVGSIPYLAVQLAAVQRDPYAIAGRHRGGVANDGGLVRVPAHRVTAPEHGQRTEAVQARGAAAKARIGGVPEPMHCGRQLAVGADE